MTDEKEKLIAAPEKGQEDAEVTQEAKPEKEKSFEQIVEDDGKKVMTVVEEAASEGEVLEAILDNNDTDEAGKKEFNMTRRMVMERLEDTEKEYENTFRTPGDIESHVRATKGEEDKEEINKEEVAKSQEDMQNEIPSFEDKKKSIEVNAVKERLEDAKEEFAEIAKEAMDLASSQNRSFEEKRAGIAVLHERLEKMINIPIIQAHLKDIIGDLRNAGNAVRDAELEVKREEDAKNESSLDDLRQKIEGVKSSVLDKDQKLKNLDVLFDEFGILIANIQLEKSRMQDMLECFNEARHQIENSDNKSKKEKSPEEIFENVQSEIKFLDISTLSPEEKLEAIDNQLRLLEPLLENVKDYDNYSEAKNLERKLTSMRKSLGIKTEKSADKQETAPSDIQNERTPEDLLKESEERFEEAYKSVGAYNQTMPNYFKKRFESLKKITDGLDKDASFNRETADLVKKAVAKDMESVLRIMAEKGSIDTYFTNPGEDQGKHESIDSVSYIEKIKRGNIGIEEAKKQLENVDKEIAALAHELDTNLFAREWSSAKLLLEAAEESKNPRERQVNLAIAMHTLENIRKGLKDKGVREALKIKL